MKIFLGSLFILILISCTSNVPQSITTPQPSETPKVNAIVTAKILDVSKTPSPTKSPTNTPVSFLSSYTFPAWMSNPETNILAALITNDLEKTRKISFFNADTGENYEIEMPRDVSGYFWYDSSNFGFLSKDLTTAYRINLQTGKVFPETVSSQATRFLSGLYEYDDYENSYGDTANALEIINDTNSGEMLFRKTWYGEYGTKSKNGRYSAEWSGVERMELEYM
ncbi:MAG TPA: hypothetical protein VJ785_03390 [Anaerolineales bacterium]|nr:hypothetical protein [Anaerolineales bacterium]